METTFYINYKIRRSNGANVWITSKNFDNLDKANELFQEKVKDPRVTEANLFKCEVWTDPNEIPFETTTNRTPYGWKRTNSLASYNPQFWGGIKIWDID